MNARFLSTAQWWVSMPCCLAHSSAPGLFCLPPACRTSGLLTAVPQAPWLPRRCDEAASTLTLLGGLSLLHVSRDAVHLKLVTAYPSGAVRGEDPGPCATADHELSLHLQPGSSTGAWL